MPSSVGEPVMAGKSAVASAIRVFSSSEVVMIAWGRGVKRGRYGVTILKNNNV